MKEKHKMARIYKTTDRISYKIGDLLIKISPMTVQDKATLNEYMQKGRSGDTRALIEGSMFAIKAALKEVKGLEDSQGNPYNLEFDDNNYVTENCINDLMNIAESSLMVTLCSQLIAGIPSTLPEGITLVEDKNPKT